MSESISLISDDSLCTEGLYVDCLVCSNLSAGESRHYWLVEVSEGRIRHAYDSLQGVQPLTPEVYRMLQVTGVLLRSANCGKPVLRNLKLDQKAGKIEAVVRRAPAIKVTSRSRTCKTKRELVKSMNKLSIAPTKLNFFSKKLGKKVEGLNAELASKSAPSHLIFARGPKDRRPHAPSYARKPTKRKAQPKRTRRLGVPVNKTHKGISELLSQPSLHEQRRPKNIGQLGDDSVESVSDSEIPGCEAPMPKNSEEIVKRDASYSSADKASDPISDFVTQDNGSGNSPHREKKRTFTQAELEEPATVPRVTEDDLRRKQGPPRAGPESPTVQPDGPDAKPYGNQPSVCPEGQTNGAKGEHGSKSDGEMGKSPDIDRDNREGECIGRGELQSSASGTACCRAQPGQGGGTTNQTVVEPATSAGAFVSGRYGIISLFDGVSSVVPILKKKLGYRPVAVILAKCDRSLRQLVCTEFDYRSDERWGYTPDGSAVLYLRDVNSVIAGHCKVLQELVQMFPDCKWIILGGSPCQDLTFAGPLRGLLGLIGPSSRLFFVLLCVISTMQQLVFPAAVRYLVENGASMQQIHLDAFCRLLRLPPDQHGRYVWDPCDFGFQITRRRNYFRNFDDVEDSARGHTPNCKQMLNIMLSFEMGKGC